MGSMTDRTVTLQDVQNIHKRLVARYDSLTIEIEAREDDEEGTRSFLVGCRSGIEEAMGILAKDVAGALARQVADHLFQKRGPR